MFNTLKGLGEQIASSAREFEQSLAQPLIPSPGRPDSPARIAQPTTSPARRTASPSPSPSPIAPNVNVAVQSASQLADSALSSLRLSLRKGRASLDTARAKTLDAVASTSPRPSLESPVERAVKLPEPAALTEEPAPVAPEPVPEEKEPEEEEKVEVVTEDAPATPEPPSAIAATRADVDGPAPPPPPVSAPVVEVTDTPPLPLSPPAIEPSAPISDSPSAPPPLAEEAAPPLLLLRPASPDARFAISGTADATPEGPSRTPTPSNDPVTVSPLLVVTPDEPVEDTLPTLVEEPPASVPVPAPAEIPLPMSPIVEDIPLPLIAPASPVIDMPEEGEPAQAPVEQEKPAVSEPVIIPAEISKELEELKALKATLDRIVSNLLPLAGVADVDDFERELRNMADKTKLAMAEVGRLNAQLTQQKERMEELRDTHRLEEKSQSEQLDALGSQLADKVDALNSVNEQLVKEQDEVKALKAAAVKAVEEHDKLKLVAKEEEEKRTKALSLLRALRQKLVKAEKDREEVERDRDALKAAENAAQETLKSDRARFDQEIVSLRAAQELQLHKLRQSFDREVHQMRQQHEREAQAKKGQFELDTITTKSLHVKELQTKDARIAQLEGTVKEITAGRDALFDQLQLRTAEIESSSAHQESLQGQTGELQYELQEARDRALALMEELEELRKARRDMTRDDGNTRRLLVEAEKRHDAKVRDLEARAAQLEKDRQETEEEMGRNLQDRLREVERMRQQIVQKDIDYAQSVHLQQQRDAKIEDSETKRRELEAKVKGLEALLRDLRVDVAKSTKAEAAAREELSERLQRASELEQRLDEVQNKESSLRSNNKLLRDELRKLQSGVLLSEKQRQPGVGYFAAYQNPGAMSSTVLPVSPGGSDGSRTPKSESRFVGESSSSNGAAPSVANGEEAVNFEYLRNVILQFLERPEMRPHLLGVLGVILHFTPAEARRLAAKATR